MSMRPHCAGNPAQRTSSSVVSPPAWCLILFPILICWCCLWSERCTSGSSRQDRHLQEWCMSGRRTTGMGLRGCWRRLTWREKWAMVCGLSGGCDVRSSPLN
jgi:hypothetical protein